MMPKLLSSFSSTSSALIKLVDISYTGLEADLAT